MPSNDNDVQVIAAVIEGQTDLFRVLVEKYHMGLIRHLTHLCQNDQQQAEDIAQQAFIRAFDKLHLYDNKHAFSTWLYKIADNIAFRELKRQKNNVVYEDIEESLADDKEGPEQAMDRSLTKHTVRRALHTLSPHYQQVLTLYYWDDFSYEQISSIIDRPIGTVRTWIFRAKDELRKELNGQI